MPELQQIVQTLLDIDHEWCAFCHNDHSQSPGNENNFPMVTMMVMFVVCGGCGVLLTLTIMLLMFVLEDHEFVNGRCQKRVNRKWYTYAGYPMGYKKEEEEV